VDLAQTGAKKGDVQWTSVPTIATTRDADKHTAIIEASFAAPAIVGASKEGAQLPMGLFRMEGVSPRKYLAWSPTHTKSPNFHVPEAFGALVLDP